MNKDIKYITELTASDLQEISAAVNPVAGFCMKIERTNGVLKIGIDEKALAMAINGFVRNGGTQTNAADATNISFNPPS